MYGLAALEQEILDLGAAALDACERPVPEKRYRYHGDIAVQCCEDNGIMTVHWNPVVADKTGIPQGVGAPVGKRTADVILRLYRCFPTLREDGTFPDDEGDPQAEGLAIDMDCLWSAFTAAICDGSLAESLAGCDALSLIDVTPRKPAGGCAGISFRFRAQWRPWALDAP